MKPFHLLAIIFSIVFANLCCAEQETPELPVTPIKELKVEEIDFANLPKESQIGNLAEVVKGTESLLEKLCDYIHNQLILHPHTEGLAYVNGQLCHVSHYSQSIIYTILDGPYYGTQTTMTYNGAVLYVNYDYTMEYTPHGVVLHHYYSDSEVVTGSNQVIIFH
jgi:hypothetical protein